MKNNIEYVQDNPLDVYSVRMSAKHARHAREIAAHVGEDSLSEGVRDAIEERYKQIKSKIGAR